MITINKLKKVYQGTIALDLAGLDIPHGQCLGILGNNGAGKTTLFQIMLDLVKPSDGHVINFGIQVDQSEKWKTFTGGFLDEQFLIGFLTPKEYFSLIAKIRDVGASSLQSLLETYHDFFSGEVLRGKKKYIRSLSKGNQKKVGLVASLIGNPKVLILDEPFANLDTSSQMLFKEKIRDLKKNDPNKIILISSHNIDHIFDVCDRVILLEKGKIVKDFLASENLSEEVKEYFRPSH